MDELRLTARGRFEELKDRRSELDCLIRNLAIGLHRAVPVPEIPAGEPLSRAQLGEAETLVREIYILADERQAVHESIMALVEEWGFRE